MWIASLALDAPLLYFSFGFLIEATRGLEGSSRASGGSLFLLVDVVESS